MKKIFIFITLLAAIACSNVPDPVHVDIDELQTEVKASAVIPLEEALGGLDNMLAALYPGTKAGVPRYDRNDVIVFGRPATKSGNSTLPDTTVYIVNFNDNSGFAVLAAQSGMPDPIICVTESGSLTSDELADAIANFEGEVLPDVPLPDDSDDDEVDDGADDEECTDSECTVYEDEGEDFVAELLAEAIALGLEKVNTDFDITDDSNNNSDGSSGENVPITGGDGSSSSGSSSGSSTPTYETVSKIGPFLETKWHQASPFNDFRSQIDSAVAGCVAIATAQILACNEYDTKTGKNFDWSLLKSVCNYTNYNTSDYSESAKAAVSSFIEFVGNPDNCDIDYDRGSGSCAKRAKVTLKHFGYTNVKKYCKYNDSKREKIISQLTEGLPVYMEGRVSSRNGHAWVIDGVYVRNKILSGKITNEQFFHINWGWKGKNDGYFTQGVFDITQRAALEGGIDSGGSIQDGLNYVKHYRIVLYSK